MFGNKQALDFPSSSSKRQKSSLSSKSQWKYDVFLSFRGEDTRDNFTDHLYTALKHKGLITFRDDERLERGKEISSELLESIESSRFSIIIFSKNYASSKWCLEELAKIIECKDMKVPNVFPVFYKVDPSDIRNQKGDFKTAFDKHEKDFKDNLEKVQRWQSALKQVCNLSGWHLKDGRSEAGFITAMVDTIWKRLNINSNAAEDFVGIDSSVEKMYELLEPGSNDTRFIGIWGMGGVGKTTLAKVVFDSLSHKYKYDVMCFLPNVREVSKQSGGITRLQEMLLSKVPNESNLQICDPYEGINCIRRWLCHKRVLVVLDDVDNQLEQLEKLAGKHYWFGSGSRIIVTARDKHVLISHGISSIYELQRLEHDDALQLFHMKAFKHEQPIDNYVELSEKIVQYVKGLPLALVLLGSSLCGKSVEEWKSALNRLRQAPNKNILKQLRISYYGLEEIEKKIFLDIACFFKWKNKDRVMEILDSCDFHSTFGIRVLIDRSLITISYGNKLDMHDLLQEMGWEIVREQHPNNCGKWSRLWQFEDVYHVLTDNKGTHEVEGIMFNKSKRQIPHLDCKSFSRMSKLRLLKISNVDLPKDLIYLSNELRFLKWDGYPSNSLPSTFQAQELFELNLCHSKIKYLWKGMKTFEKLKNIKLSYSHNFIETPDFTGVPNLETLNLEGCSRLRELHKSVGFLQRLFMLNLKGCKNLESFPSNICGLKYCLRTLNFEDCSKLDKLPPNLEVLECLEELNASGTLIRQVPSSIVKLTNLQKFSFRDCRDQPSQTLMSYLWSYMFPQSRNESLRLPSLAGLHSLKSLVLSGCNLSEETLPNDLDSLASLEQLDLSRNNFVNLPESISRLPKLEILCLRECERLRSLPELPGQIYFVGTEHCTSLEAMSWSTLCTSRNIVLLHLFNCFKLVENQDKENSLPVMLLKLHLRELSFKSVGFHICLPGSEIPAAFKHWSTDGSEIKFGLSPNWYTDEFMGIAVCAIVPEVSSELYGLCKCRISCIIEIGSRHMTYHFTIPSHVRSDHLWLGYLSIQEMIATQFSDPNDLRCIHVRVILFRYYPDHNPLNSVADNRSPIMLPAKRCGIRMVYESELENFEEFPAGSNIFQHNHGDVCDALDIRVLVSMSDLSPPRIINCESNSLALRAPSPHILATQIPTSLSPFEGEFLGRIGEMGGRDDFYREFLGRIGEMGGRDDFYREFLERIREMLGGRPPPKTLSSPFSPNGGDGGMGEG